MSIPRPNYQRYDISLNAAGQQDIPAEFTYLRLVSATDVNGNQALSTVVNVNLGRGQSDQIPVQLNGLIKIPGGIDFARLSWAAQAGVIATFIISDQDEESGIQLEAPTAKQIVTTSVGTTLTAAQTTAGVAAAQLIAASSTRQRATIRNLSPSETVFIGGAGVTTATGFPVFPSEVLTLDGQTAPIFAIATAAATPVSTLVEQ